VPAPIQVKPPGMRVDLHSHAMLDAGSQHLFDIDVISRPPQQLPPLDVAEDRGVRVGDGAEQAIRSSLAAQLEAAMNAPHDEIEPVQDVVQNRASPRPECRIRCPSAS
jgi:hypothetical protein